MYIRILVYFFMMFLTEKSKMKHSLKSVLNSETKEGSEPF